MPSKYNDYVMFGYPATNKIHPVPKTYKEALSSADQQLWLDAMNDEFFSLLGNNTWELVDRPEDANVTGSRWIYNIKKQNNGTLKYKARLVA